MKPALKKALKVKWNPAWNGGARCSACSHSKHAQITRDVRDFAKAKKRGHPMPWAVFIREYLEQEYKHGMKVDTFLHHVRRCLKLEA